MLTLQEMLKLKTHRNLELLARAHDLAFTRREPKALGLAQLAAALQDGAYEQAFQNLTSAEIEPLQALVVAGGWMPLYLFSHHFGSIRPYRPWRKPEPVIFPINHRENPRHPWRYPASVAERLFHLGFIHIRDKEMVGLVREAHDLLPPLPQAQPLNSPVPSTALGSTGWGMKSDLLRDMAALLGTLMQLDVRPVHDRWFTLSTMREINERLYVKEENLDTTDTKNRVPTNENVGTAFLPSAISPNNYPIRSELQTGRLRWLHYLAQVSGLLSIQAGFFKPTVAAWEWLRMPSGVQWDALMLSVERDLETRSPVWNIYRFPEMDCPTWRILRLTVKDLDPAQMYRVKNILESLRPYLLTPDNYALGVAVRDMLQWSGVLILRHGKVFVHQHGFPAPQTASYQYNDKEIVLRLPVTPVLDAFMALLAFARVESHYAIVDVRAIRHAVRQGFDTAYIVQLLTKLTGQPLADLLIQQIQTWVKQAQCVTLKPMLVLETDSRETLQALRSDWRLNPFFGARLSPAAVAVAAETAPELLRRLERREVEVTSSVPPKKERRITDKFTPEMAEYLLLAVHTYQKLQSRLEAAITIPRALNQWLESYIDDPASLAASIEVNINIGRKRTFCGKKPLKHQFMGNGVNGRDTQQVGNEGMGSRTLSLSANILFSGITHHIPDQQKVIR